MANPQCNKLMDFLDENPQLKGNAYGGKNANISRINDGWYEQDEYWLKADAVIQYVKSLRKLIPDEIFEKNIDKHERINWE